MLDDLLPQGNQSHSGPVRTCPRTSSGGVKRFKAFLATVQICTEQTNKQNIDAL